MTTGRTERGGLRHDINDKEEMVGQLRELITKVESGEVVAYMACWVHSDDELGGAGLCKPANLSRMHDSIIEMHETFHDVVDDAHEEARARDAASKSLASILVMSLGKGDGDAPEEPKSH